MNTFKKAILATSLLFFLFLISKQSAYSFSGINIDAAPFEGNTSPSGVIYNNELYVGESDAFGPSVYKYDGIDWLNISSGSFPVGAVEIQSLAVYDGLLYAALYDSSYYGGEVWSYDGTDWTLAIPGTNEVMISRMIVYQNLLYIGVSDFNLVVPAGIYTYDGVSFSEVLTNPWAGSNNIMIDSFEVFNNLLYVGTSNWTDGAELWTYDGDSTWEQVYSGGINADIDNVSVHDLEIFDGDLYFSTENWVEGTQVFSLGGTQINNNGFDGTPDSPNENSILKTFNGRFFAGTYNDDDDEASMWEYVGSSWIEIPTDLDTGTDIFLFFVDHGNYLYTSVASQNESADVQKIWQFSEGADLAVSFSNTPLSAISGDEVSFDFTVSNLGPDTAVNATFSIDISESLSFISINAPGWTCTEANKVIDCAGQSLSNGDSFTVTIEAEAETIGLAAVIGSATSETPDSNESNNDDNFDFQIGILIPADPLSADIGILFQDAPAAATIGDNISFDFTITNLGPDVATNTTFSINISEFLSFISINAPGWTCTETAGVINCSGLSLSIGGSSSVTLEAKAELTGLAEVTGTADSAIADPDITNNNDDFSFEITALTDNEGTDIGVSFSDTPHSAKKGDDVSFDFTVVNLGQNIASHVTFVIVLPSALSFISTNDGLWRCTEKDGTISCSGQSLGKGASSTITVLARTEEDGTIEITGSASMATVDTNPSNNYDDFSIEIEDSLVENTNNDDLDRDDQLVETGTNLITIYGIVTLASSFFFKKRKYTKV